MHTETFELSRTLPRPADEVFRTFAEPVRFAKLLGGGAKARPDGAVGLQDGAVFGPTLEVEAPRALTRTWRSPRFEPSVADARVELSFEAVGRGTRLTVRHAGLPPAEADGCIAFWLERCLDPLSAPPRRARR